jgi:hypothetical protein
VVVGAVVDVRVILFENVFAPLILWVVLVSTRVIADVIDCVEGKVKVVVVPNVKPPLQVVQPVIVEVPPTVWFAFTVEVLHTTVPVTF